MKVVLLPQAQEDLDHIYDPIYSRIVRRLRLLERFPEMGAPMIGPFTGYRPVTFSHRLRFAESPLPRNASEFFAASLYWDAGRLFHRESFCEYYSMGR